MSEYITSFQTEKTLAHRQSMAADIRKKYPDRLAIIMDRSSTRDPGLKKNKFLVPGNLTLGQFIFVLRKRLKMESPHRPIAATEAIYVHINRTNIFPPLAELLSQVYADHKDEDGFLYLNYGLENAFG